MTEYWKSQARKYCSFCKCWFADNKVSISFHESGKRHKENVQKHLSQLTKKSTKDFKQKEKIDDDLKKMETAAMAAYLKDVQNNADLTSQFEDESGPSLSRKRSLEVAETSEQLKPSHVLSINDMLGRSCEKIQESVSTAAENEPRAPPVWHEVKADEGSYFWNTQTNDTTWDPPDDYLSLVDQEAEKLKKEEAKKNLKRQKEEKKKEAMTEAKAHIAREKMRELAPKKEKPEPPSSMHFGPAPRAADPYGSWKPVETKVAAPVDLQLPKPDKEVVPPPVVQPERVQFGERATPSLGAGPVQFKKRKLHQRNARQKTDDDLD